MSREAEAAATAESAVELRHDDPPVWTVMLAGACAFLTLYATQPILPLLADVFQVNKAAVSRSTTSPESRAPGSVWCRFLCALHAGEQTEQLNEPYQSIRNIGLYP